LDNCNGSEFDSDYFERGPVVGKSLYTNYRWLPELTIPLAHHLAIDCGLEENSTICDFGCAKGYLVYALRLLGYKSYGVDISEYAVSKAPKEVNGYVSCIEPGVSFGEYDWIICKDILEHIPYENISDQLEVLAQNCRAMMAMIPLGDGEKYFIEAYEHDSTHVIREDLEWWKNKFEYAGFDVALATNEMGWYKENWQNLHPQGNGLFYLRGTIEMDMWNFDE
tara:strand:+ start:334 stop:1002 length:669 start_codon:yes stop_codon:yes gene_type:complete